MNKHALANVQDPPAGSQPVVGSKALLREWFDSSRLGEKLLNATRSLESCQDFY